MEAEGTYDSYRDSPMIPAVPAPLFLLGDWLGEEVVVYEEYYPLWPVSPALLFLLGELTGNEVVGARWQSNLPLLAVVLSLTCVGRRLPSGPETVILPGMRSPSCLRRSARLVCLHRPGRRALQLRPNCR